MHFYIFFVIHLLLLSLRPTSLNWFCQFLITAQFIKSAGHNACRKNRNILSDAELKLYAHAHRKSNNLLFKFQGFYSHSVGSNRERAACVPLTYSKMRYFGYTIRFYGLRHTFAHSFSNYIVIHMKHEMILKRVEFVANNDSFNFSFD